MSADPNQHSREDDPLENTELARRLRRMEWPPAPPEVKARVLRRIVGRGDDEGDNAADPPPESAS